MVCLDRRSCRVYFRVIGNGASSGPCEFLKCVIPQLLVKQSRDILNHDFYLRHVPLFDWFESRSVPERSFVGQLGHQRKILGSMDNDSMTWALAEDGCPSFVATVHLDTAQVGYGFHWGVILDGPQGSNQWGIATEVTDVHSNARTRSFRLSAASNQTEQRHYLTNCRRLSRRNSGPWGPTSRRCLATWAPAAQAVSVVFGSWTNGYIDDHGGGCDTRLAEIPLKPVDGFWQSDLANSPSLADFAACDHYAYMYKVTFNGSTPPLVKYRTDLHSRCQIGAGKNDPNGLPFPVRSPGWMGASAARSLSTPIPSPGRSKTRNGPLIEGNSFRPTCFGSTSSIRHGLCRRGSRIW